LAVKLRLRRMGKIRQPIYKVVAADARAPRDGRIIEAIGLYNPKTEPATIEINEDRALYWLGVGAQPTDTVKNLLSKKGILLKKELIKQGLSENEIANKMEEFTKAKEAKIAKKLEKNAKAKETSKNEATKKAEEKAEKVEEKTENSEAEGASSDEQA